MLRSLHIIGSRKMGGAEQFFQRLVRGLNGPDHRAMAVVRPGSELRPVVGDSTRQFHVPMRNGWDILSGLAIRRLVRNEGIDIVQSYMGRGTRLTRIPDGWGVKHVARLGGYYKIDGYYRHAHAWVGNTRKLCDYLVQQGLPSERVFYIGNFVEPRSVTPPEDRERLRRSLRLPEDAFVLFALGRFTGVKGFDDLLPAFARLPAEVGGRPFFLVIAGDGPLKKNLLAQAAELGIEERLRWAGWQNDPHTYFDLADLFVCPSRHETLGNVILEAWAHRLPVVSTSSLGGAELIRDGENGLLVPCQDPVGMADRMSELIRAGDSDRSRIAERGYQTLCSEHSPEAVLAAYRALYQELLTA
ncbi:MAG: glycosyltransferase [Desulfuromonas sp.]|uniref:glycosyltransferase n=1 Tax=Desulfuromonas sp. TaxID=892 RepID=UPI000CB23CE3|nr:glycosyltransferase [Desulfuromonas sp.]PLX85969.1 MAG: glycosyltransferase [Desulfuromonas sp.]